MKIALAQKANTKTDLHMHTHHSDGELSVRELLIKCQQVGLQTLSITDHGTMAAYQELQGLLVKQLFPGTIIPGVELYSFFQEKAIEILAYGVDIAPMAEFCETNFGNKWYEAKRKRVISQLQAICSQMGIAFNPNEDYSNLSVGECSAFLKHLKSFPQNREKLGEEIWTNKVNFFRDCVNNTSSPFYINYTQFYPSPEKVIQFIHSCGGKAFLAHTYVYGFENEMPLLEAMKQSGIDGIECYYPLFTNSQIQFLKQFCHANNLLISAGSDFHGSSRPNLLGVPSPHQTPTQSDLAWTQTLRTFS